jgi:hypothetical protein
MPSWVVPAVAAELWGVTVEHVLSEVAAGRVISRCEGEFIFVDVDPNAQHGSPQETRPTTYRRSLTWTVGASEHVQQPLVTPAEREALLDDSHDAIEPNLDTPYGEAPAPTPLTDDDIPDWRAVRARVARTRIPPAKSLAA